MSELLLSTLMAILVLGTKTLVAQDSEHLRQGEPAACFLFDWGKGPNGIVDLTHEFRLALLDHWQPFVDDTRETEPEAFQWSKAHTRPKITTLIHHQGRRIVRVEYFETSDRPNNIPCVMLAMESAVTRDWFTPFFVAQPELYSDTMVVGKSGRIAVVATLSRSGTGGFRDHHVFELGDGHPTEIGVVSAGRVRSIDYGSEKEYKEALKIFDREAAVFRGEFDQLESIGE